MRYYCVPLLVALTLSTQTSCICLSFLTQFDCSFAYLDHRYEKIKYVDYVANPNKKTPRGIEVDTSGADVDLKKLDQLTAEVAQCLKRPILRCGFVVKIAPDWHYQDCAGLELFSCKLPGFENCGSNPCPCGCTGIVQYPSTIVVTPNLAAYKHELIHVVTKADHGSAFFKCQ